MDQKTRAFHAGLIRLAKGAIKLWEAYIAPPSDHYQAVTPPPEQAVPPSTGDAQAAQTAK